VNRFSSEWQTLSRTVLLSIFFATTANAVHASTAPGAVTAIVPAELAAQAPPVVQAGQPFPKLQGLDQYNNKFSLSKLKGKYVLVEFSTLWCPPSQPTTYWLGLLRNKVQAAGIPFEAVEVLLQNNDQNVLSSTRNRAEANAVRRNLKTVLYNPYDPANPKTALLWNVFQATGTNAFPTFVMLAPDGTVLNIKPGVGIGATIPLRGNSCSTTSPASSASR